MSYQLQLLDPNENSKLRSDRRIFSLSLNADAPVSSTGLLDKRLFTGENKLVANKDPQYQLWSLSYEHGIVPEALKQKFTSFKVLVKFATDYFDKRHITIKEIID